MPFDRGQYRSRRQQWLDCTAVVVLIWTAVAAIIAAVWALGWFLAGVAYFDYRQQYLRGTTLQLRRQLLPDGWNIFGGALWFYILAFVIVLATALIIDETAEDTVTRRSAWAVCALLLVGCVFGGNFAVWDNDKDAARANLTGTQVVVSDLANPPDSLEPLLKGALEGGPGIGCVKVGNHDVDSCIVRGQLTQSWEIRRGSFSGASYVMSHTGGGVSNSKLLETTMTYVYDGTPGHWTAIRDGVNGTPIYKIISWDGRSRDAKDGCFFKGKYEINKAFAGQWDSSLTDDLAGKYPSLQSNPDDMWGYCLDDTVDGKTVPGIRPRLVLPMIREVSYEHRTVSKAAGVVTIEGSPNGEPVYHHYPNVKPGQFPGPVYPLSLAAKQRSETQWLASRGVKSKNQFGFVPIDTDAGSDNISEYLLRDTASDRLFWVSPLQPRQANTLEADAYSAIPADEVTDRMLNVQKLYVLQDKSPEIALLDDMVNKAEAYLVRFYPTLLNTGGAIAEMNPVTNETWQIIVDYRGRQKFSVIYTLDESVEPKITDLDPTIKLPTTVVPTQPQPGTGGRVCAKPVEAMTREELRKCGVAVIDRLGEEDKAA